MPSRRRVLGVCAGAAGTILAGCLSGASATGGDDTPTDRDTDTDTDTPTPTPTQTCSATDPPAPTDAATSPRSYPDRPAELTTETIEPFLESYERAYQYNDALAADPNKIGHTNEFTVYVRPVSVESGNGRFTADLSGQLQSDIVEPEPATTTPETPTETPLPMGRGPFETSYVITSRELRREGVVVECW